MVSVSRDIALKGETRWLVRLWEFTRRHPTVVAGMAVVVGMSIVAVAAPYLSSDPIALDPIKRLRPPSGDNWFGTDMLGRDIYSRTLYGSRISMTVGLSVAGLATSIGLLIGLISGYNRAVDAVVMRIMDGLMAIPDILLAIALVAITSATVENVVMAITIPQIPQVARLVRSIVLTIREQPYMEAAISIGTRVPKLIFRHIMPNTVAPLIIQGSYVCATAMITEALLGFIGAGTPPEIPRWGNIMSEGSIYFELAPWIIFFPGIFLTVTVLGVNILGDGLRYMLDPRLARQM